MKKILVIEDDKNMGFLLEENLKMGGFLPSLALDGEAGLKLYSNQVFDCCVIDIMLPKKDGIEITRDIRKKDKKMPVILLTARSLTEDKLEGFKSGCDDYLTKPFQMEELILRIKALLKRRAPLSGEDLIFNIGIYEFNASSRILKNEKKSRKLSAKEAGLLKILVEHINNPVSRKKLLNEVWGRDDYFASKSMDVFLSKVRRHLKKDPGLELINIHGFGYKLREK